MREDPLFSLQAETAAAFNANGERTRMHRYLERGAPGMSDASRQRVTRQVGRALDLFGRRAVNLAIDDIDTFEARLKATPIAAHGYPASLRQTLQNAARYLHAAARDANTADLQRLLNRKRRKSEAGDPEPLSIAQTADPATPMSDSADKKAAKPTLPTIEQNRKTSAAVPMHRLSASPTLADLDAVVDQLVALQRKLGAQDPRPPSQVIEMLVDTLGDAGVLHLLTTIPDGTRRSVGRGTEVPQRPSVSDVARRVLVDLVRDRVWRRCGTSSADADAARSANARRGPDLYGSAKRN